MERNSTIEEDEIMDFENEDLDYIREPNIQILVKHASEATNASKNA